MAESGTGGSWWSGFVQAAKDKSASAMDMVKKDLAEFTTTMQEDTTAAATEVKSKLTHENAAVVTEKAKKGVTQLFGGLTKALSVEAEDLHTSKPRSSVHSKHIFDRAQARLNAIQVDPETYCEAPTGSKDEYEDWLISFQLDQKKGDISELLVANVEVRALYTQLVPSQVSHADFWQRYFYKLHQLSMDEKRKADLMKRADDVQEECGWDDDDDWGDLDGPSSPPHAGGMDLAAEALSTAPHKTTDSPTKNNQDNNDDKCSITSSDVSDNYQDIEQAKDVVVVGDKSAHDDVGSGGQNEHEDSSSNKVDNTQDVSSAFNIDKLTVSDNKVEQTESNNKVEIKPNEQEMKTPLSPEDSSLSISSITDNSKQQSNKESSKFDPNMVSSSDTLTLVSPKKKKVPTAESESSSTALTDNQDITPPSLESSTPITDTTEHIETPVNTQSEPGLTSQDVPLTEDERPLKTRDKGDLVVVGSGASSSSDGTTPSTESSNKGEIEDDWEKEFEVTEDDLLKHHVTTTIEEKPVVEADSLQDEMEDDWENWD